MFQNSTARGGRRELPIWQWRSRAATTNGQHDPASYKRSGEPFNAAPQVPEPLRWLVASVEGLASPTAVVEPATLARVLRDFANALELLPEPDRPTSSKIRAGAEDLAKATDAAAQSSALDR